MNLWQLPQTALLGGREFAIRPGWQDVMAVMALLQEAHPPWVCWYRAIARFYAEPIPDELVGEAAAFLADFISAGQPQTPGPQLMDWQQDAMEILSDINRVAGVEVRRENVHWWTFLAWFHAIGEGQLSNLVAIRSKLARGQKLTEAEQEYYRRNRGRVRLEAPDDPEKQRLLAMLK